MLDFLQLSGARVIKFSLRKYNAIIRSFVDKSKHVIPPNIKQRILQMSFPVPRLHGQIKQRKIGLSMRPVTRTRHSNWPNSWRSGSSPHLATYPHTAWRIPWILSQSTTRSKIYEINIFRCKKHVHTNTSSGGDTLNAEYVAKKFRSHGYYRWICDSSSRLPERKYLLLWWESLLFPGCTPNGRTTFLSCSGRVYVFFRAQDPFQSLTCQLRDIMAPLRWWHFKFMDW